MLKAEGIIKKYQIPGRKKDLLEALSGVSIELADNSITAIVGEKRKWKKHTCQNFVLYRAPRCRKSYFR